MQSGELRLYTEQNYEMQMKLMSASGISVVVALNLINYVGLFKTLILLLLFKG